LQTGNEYPVDIVRVLVVLTVEVNPKKKEIVSNISNGNMFNLENNTNTSTERLPVPIE